MHLPVPKEPVEIKELIRSVRKRVGGIDDIDSDSLAVWSFNRLPKYLWECWKDKLKERGITWQKFLRILKLRTMDIIEWGLYDRLRWSELVKRIEHTIETYSTRGGKSSVTT